jgi:hypothetical protein
MKRIPVLPKNYRPVFKMRRGVYTALLSFFCMVCAFASSVSLHAQAQKVDVVCIQPFQLDKPYKCDWRIERPEVLSGLLVVIKVDTNLVKPINCMERVLYAGNHTVQRLNQGDKSGYVVGIIPGPIDFTKEPVWFGSPALPEQVEAKLAGIPVMKSSDVLSRTRVKALGVYLTELLHKQAGELILEFSPQEKYIVEAWRLPGTK